MENRPLSYQAGAASVCFTPEDSLWLAGFAARTAPARGKISELYASAVVLEDAAGQRLVIASAEIIAITPAIAQPVAAAINKKHGVPRANLVLTATHTHYGPEFRADKRPFFGIPDEFAAKMDRFAATIVAALVRAIDEAFARLAPARLFVRKAAVGFARNRRQNGAFGSGNAASDVVDHDVPILECIDAAGSRTAIVFGYACHNTTIPPDDVRYCGDWAGFAKERLEENNAGAVALFVPGAGADQNPAPCGSVELAREHGRQLANAIDQALASPGVEVTGPIQTAWADVPLAIRPVCKDVVGELLESDDPPQRVKGEFLRESIERGDELITTYLAPLQIVHLGAALLLVALSGEPVVDWSHKLKREFERGPSDNSNGNGKAGSHGSPGAGPPLVWVAGYCNDLFGYLPTRRIQAEGGYEAGRASLWSWIPAPFTDDVEDRVTDALRQLVDRVEIKA